MPLGQQKQAPGGLEIERLAAARQGAHHHRAGRRQPLLRRPKRLFALLRPYDDEPARIEAEHGQTWWIRRAILGEHAFFASPKHPGAAGPAGGQAQGEPQRGAGLASPGRADFVQRLTSHR